MSTGTTTRTRALLAAACLLLLGACSAPSEDPNPRLPTSLDAAVRPDVGLAPGKISLEILSPLDGTTLTTNTPANVQATLSATGNDFIDPASVIAKLVPLGAANIVSQTLLVGPVGSDTYKGQLSLAGLKLGQYVLTVSAATTNGASAQRQVMLLLDNGPQIVVLSPLPGGHYKGGVIVQVVADPGMYPPLMDLRGSAGGIPLQLTMNDPSNPNHYDALVDFHQPMPPLTGTQLFVISAANNNGARTELRFIFVVDEQGPLITATTPVPGEILTSVVRIAARIQDDAGLNEASVVAVISDKLTPEYRLPLRPEAGGFWSVLFDSHIFPSCRLNNTDLCVVRPTLSFRAADQLGNETTLTYEVALDNIPPIADLTPPTVRDSKLDDGVRCSFAFDPLSNNTSAGDMPNDGCMVPQVFDLRARIEDDGNRAVDLKTVPISLVDPEKTAVYVLDDTSQPLVVDSDGDGFCDAVNPQLVPTTEAMTDPRQVLKVRLGPVPKGGAADFRADMSIGPPLSCMQGKDMSPPKDLCIGNQPTLAITYAGMEPAIWTLEPIDNNYCFGPQFDTYANNVGQGWKCIAVVTADKNGNTSTSVPLRVWVDYKYASQSPNLFCAAPPGNAGPPPSCTGIYDRQMNKVTAGACKARKFRPGEICVQGQCPGCTGIAPLSSFGCLACTSQAMSSCD